MRNEQQEGMSTDTAARLQIVEGGLQRLERSVQTLADNFSKFLERTAQQPRAIPFKEVLWAVAATCGILTYASNYLEGQYQKNQAVLQFRVEQLERTTEKPAYIPLGVPNKN